jgi:alpha-ketoglutarate-dependent taurine dioxygenase
VDQALAGARHRQAEGVQQHDLAVGDAQRRLAGQAVAHGRQRGPVGPRLGREDPGPSRPAGLVGRDPGDGPLDAPHDGRVVAPLPQVLDEGPGRRAHVVVEQLEVAVGVLGVLDQELPQRQQRLVAAAGEVIAATGRAVAGAPVPGAEPVVGGERRDGGVERPQVVDDPAEPPGGDRCPPAEQDRAGAPQRHLHLELGRQRARQVAGGDHEATARARRGAAGIDPVVEVVEGGDHTPEPVVLVAALPEAQDLEVDEGRQQGQRRRPAARRQLAHRGLQRPHRGVGARLPGRHVAVVEVAGAEAAPPQRLHEAVGLAVLEHGLAQVPPHRQRLGPEELLHQRPQRAAVPVAPRPRHVAPGLAGCARSPCVLLHLPPAFPPVPAPVPPHVPVRRDQTPAAPSSGTAYPVRLRRHCEIWSGDVENMTNGVMFYAHPHDDLAPARRRCPVTITEPAIDLDVVPLSGSIGAEIRGLDLCDIDDGTVAAVRQVWLDRKVVFFPGQHLGPDDHLAFARRLGEPTEGHPVIPGIDGHPEVFEIDYTAARLQSTYGDVSTKYRGIAWHTDVTFVRRPPLGSILRAVVVPPSGGDTLFSDQQAAFESLSPALQDFLSTLTAVHDGRPQFQGLLDRLGEGSWEGNRLRDLEPVEHPVVRTHPETGAKVLFVNPGFTSHMVQLERAESDALLAFLHAHSVRPEHTVRYHWKDGDVGFWDNRATQHAVVGDFGDQHRVIQRVTLRGDEPV